MRSDFQLAGVGRSGGIDFRDSELLLGLSIIFIIRLKAAGTEIQKVHSSIGNAACLEERVHELQTSFDTELW